MKNTYLLIFNIFIGISLMAQSVDRDVIGCAGQGFQGAGLQLQWTLGESFNDYFYTENGTQTEGFNQPVLPADFPFTATSAVNKMFRVNVSPNPFTDRFILNLAHESEAPLTVKICNISGVELFSDVLPAHQQQMEFYYHSLHAGWYLIKLTNHNTGELKGIIKVAKAGL